MMMYRFPDPENAAAPGIVCATEELDEELLVSAYMQGIFPWYEEARGEPVMWWCPDPRFVLFPEELHVPKRLRRFLSHTPYTYTMDTAFERVIENCASAARPGQYGTWIGSRMREVYAELYRGGIAHSVEVRRGAALVGGFYGVLIGSVFFGESMFSLESETAKSAFALFVQAFAACGGRLIDSQVYTSHVARFGARNISRAAFLRLERRLLYEPLAHDIAAVFAQTVSGKRYRP